MATVSEERVGRHAVHAEPDRSDKHAYTQAEFGDNTWLATSQEQGVVISDTDWTQERESWTPASTLKVQLVTVWVKPTLFVAVPLIIPTSETEH